MLHIYTFYISKGHAHACRVVRPHAAAVTSQTETGRALHGLSGVAAEKPGPTTMPTPGSTRQAMELAMSEAILKEMAPAVQKAVKTAVDDLLHEDDNITKKLNDSKGSSKDLKKKAQPADENREQGPDLRDCRCRDDVWPCYGSHAPGAWRGNQHGRWLVCTVCALRLQYQPRCGSAGERVKCHNPAVVEKALSMLQNMSPKDSKAPLPTAKQVSAMIQQAAASMTLKTVTTASRVGRKEGSAAVSDDDAEKECLVLEEDEECSDGFEVLEAPTAPAL
jgi:hypothetical protein